MGQERRRVGWSCELAAAVVAVAAYSGAVSFGLLKAIALVTELRPSARAEGVGLDLSEHGEEAYAQGEGAILLDAADLTREMPAAAGRPVATPA